MSNQVPEHLQSLNTIEANMDNLPVDQSWIKSLDIRLNLILPETGEEFFSIRFSGVRYSDGIIGPDGNEPLIVHAIAENGRSFPLFDQRKHGFESIMNEIWHYDNPEFKNYIDTYDEGIFKIYYCCNSSVDFTDEFETDKNGLIKTLFFGLRNIEWLRANAFDYIVVFIENVNGHVTKLFELELA